MRNPEKPDNKNYDNSAPHGKMRANAVNPGNKKNKKRIRNTRETKPQGCPAYVRARMVACVCSLIYQYDLTPLLVAKFSHMPSNKYQAKFLVYAIDKKGKVREYNVMYKDQANTYITSRIGNMRHLFYLRSVCLKLVRELMEEKPELPIILPDAYVLPLSPVTMPDNSNNYAHIS